MLYISCMHTISIIVFLLLPLPIMCSNRVPTLDLTTAVNELQEGKDSLTRELATSPSLTEPTLTRIALTLRKFNESSHLSPEMQRALRTPEAQRALREINESLQKVCSSQRLHKPRKVCSLDNFSSQNKDT